jgi:hypothetical protein
VERRDTSKATAGVAVAFFVVLIGVGAAGPAMAEVCDKAAGNRWMPDDGPMLLLGFGRGFTMLFVVGCLLVAYMFRRAAAVPLIVIGAGLVAIGGVTLSEALDAHGVYTAVVKEGCRALWADILGVALGVGVLALGGRLRCADPGGS